MLCDVLVSPDRRVSRSYLPGHAQIKLHPVTTCTTLPLTAASLESLGLDVHGVLGCLGARTADARREMPRT